MQKFPVTLFAFCCLLGLTACSDCGQSAVGAKQGEALPLEVIDLGIDKTIFLDRAITLAGHDPEALDRSSACQGQFHLTVLDVEEREIVERPAGKHDLENCVVRAGAGSVSQAVVEVRGEFVDGKLARLTYRFAASQGDRLKNELTARFGQGLVTEFEDLDQLETEERRLQVWTFDKIVWSFEPGEAGTFLVATQDLSASLVLPQPPKASVRGKPVSLEDLGIGELDLKEPEPEFDLPEMEPSRDAGRDQ